MAYKWKPSKAAKREFAEKMQNDSEFSANYYARKEKQAENKRAKSKFDYKTAGGSYIATKAQYDFCMENSGVFNTDNENAAKDMVIYSFTCKEKIEHDFIHIVNEKIRGKN